MKLIHHLYLSKFTGFVERPPRAACRHELRQYPGHRQAAQTTQVVIVMIWHAACQITLKAFYKATKQLGPFRGPPKSSRTELVNLCCQISKCYPFLAFPFYYFKHNNNEYFFVHKMIKIFVFTYLYK